MNVQLNSLVIGQGSIGRRHARLLAARDATVATVSSAAEGAFRSIEDAFKHAAYDYVVVASETSRHIEDVARLMRVGFGGRLLIEKPLAAAPLMITDFGFARVGVAYNLRFHPVVSALRRACADLVPVEIRMHVGQFLPHWRPDSDYRVQSSARTAAGGGALRDLSHEIDLLLHLFGPWRRLVSIGGNRGVLGIETDEVWSILVELESEAQVSLTLNYFDRQVERRITINTRTDTWRADLIAGSLKSGSTEEHFVIQPDETYDAQHDAMLSDEETAVCSLQEAIDVMEMITAIERSARERVWIRR